jgi:hypothetical protein
MNSMVREAVDIDRPAWARLTPAGSGLWRVADERGRPLGHVRSVADQGQRRYRAERYQGSARSFRELGEFWTASDAFDCLRYQA